MDIPHNTLTPLSPTQPSVNTTFPTNAIMNTTITRSSMSFQCAKSVSVAKAGKAGLPALPVRGMKAAVVRPRPQFVVRAAENSTTAASPVVKEEIPKLEKWDELMSFSGALPERVNGRLAMLGFVAAVGAELATGETAFTQFIQHPFSVPFHWAIFAVASAMPAVMSGNSLKHIMGSASESGMAEGMKNFNADVELLNGRAAMIGCASLLVVEGIKGSALF